MRKIMQVRNRPILLLLFGILVISAGFLIVGCGVGPQQKTESVDVGNHALDFTDCPIAGQCLVAFEQKLYGIPSMGSLDTQGNRVPGTPVTLEAWIKPKVSENAAVLQRAEADKGALLLIDADTATTVIPRFEIRHVQSDGTSSVSGGIVYDAKGTAITINAAWTYIAGILTNQNHSAVAGHPVCTDAANNPDATIAGDPWHIDFYQGTVPQDLANPVSCASTHDNQSANDDTAAADAYAHDPIAKTASPGNFQGIIDEARIWNTNRAGNLANCMKRELVAGDPDCDLLSNMIMYNRFNRNDGHTVSDWAGIMGNGGKEYPIGNNEFEDWNTGWTTDTPF